MFLHKKKKINGPSKILKDKIKKKKNWLCVTQSGSSFSVIDCFFFKYRFQSRLKSCNEALREQLIPDNKPVIVDCELFKKKLCNDRKLMADEKPVIVR